MPRAQKDKVVQGKLPYAVVKQPDPDKAVTKKAATYTYDKSLFLTVVLKQLSPDWEVIASAIEGKTRTKVYDTWRQIILPALVSGRPWSTSSSTAWCTEDKIKLVMMVVQSGKVDWTLVGKTFPGRSRAQLYDVWRQGILPRLKKGDVVV